MQYPPFIQLKASCMNHIIWLKDVEEKHVEFLGEKIVKLALCRKAGIDVPNCFIITPAAFYQFIKEAGIGQSLQDDYRNLDEDDVMALDNISKRMQRAIFSANIPEWLTAELKEAYQRMSMHEDVYELSEKIKSLVSAARGDSKVVVKLVFGDAPFVFSKPIFNVRGINTLKNAVLRAWMDAFQPENIYMLKKVGANPFKISVVVQEMVNAEKSCRALTLHPIKGSEHFLVEACYGFSVPIFENEFVADLFVLSREGFEVVERVVREKRYLYAADPIRTEIRREALNGSLERSAALDEEELKKVHEILSAICNMVDDSCLVDIAFQRDKAFVLSTTPLPFLKTSVVNLKVHQHDAENGSEPETRVSQGMKATFLTPWKAEGEILHISSEAEVSKVEKTDGVIIFVPNLSKGFAVVLHKAAGVISRAGNHTSRLAILCSYFKKAVAVVDEDITNGARVVIDPARRVVELLPEQSLEYEVDVERTVLSGETPRFHEMEDLLTAVKVGVVIHSPELSVKSYPAGEAFLVSREALESVMNSGIHFGTEVRFNDSTMNDNISASEEGNTSALSMLLSRMVGGEDSLPVWVQLHPVEMSNFLLAELNSVANLIMKGFRNVGVVLPSFLLPHEFDMIASTLKRSGMGKVRANVSVLIDRPAALFMGELLKKANLRQVVIDVDALIASAFQNLQRSNTVALSAHRGFLNMLSAGISHFNDNGFRVMVSGRAVASIDAIKMLVDHGVDCIFVEGEKLRHVKYLVARYERIAFLELLKHRHRLFRK